MPPRAKSRRVATPSKKTTKRSSNVVIAASLNGRGAPRPDLELADKLVMELMAIEGRSGDEGGVQKYIVDKLRGAGLPAAAIRTDQAHRNTPIRGQVGNLIVQLPSTGRAPRRMLVCHLDTVPLCIGCRPVKKGKFVQSARKDTGLGADNRAGCAALLSAALTILKQQLPHPPLTFLWCVQEEVGLYGARNVDLKLLGKPALAFNWDGGPAEKLTVGATGAYRISIDIEGRAAHAGGAPEQGINAITIASVAIADLQRNGWLGDIHKPGAHGTSNIGVIHGGAATNVVPDSVSIQAEARSHDPRFRGEILRAIENAFHGAATEVRNKDGQCGKVRIASRMDYEAFSLSHDEPCVLAAEAAAAAVGPKPYRVISNGGLDANWLTARGIPTVTLGCGQLNVHTTSERLDLNGFHQACAIALRLATATETAD